MDFGNTPVDFSDVKQMMDSINILPGSVTPAFLKTLNTQLIDYSQSIYNYVQQKNLSCIAYDVLCVSALSEDTVPLN